MSTVVSQKNNHSYYNPWPESVVKTRLVDLLYEMSGNGALDNEGNAFLWMRMKTHLVRFRIMGESEPEPKVSDKQSIVQLRQNWDVLPTIFSVGGSIVIVDRNLKPILMQKYISVDEGTEPSNPLLEKILRKRVAATNEEACKKLLEASQVLLNISDSLSSIIL